MEPKQPRGFKPFRIEKKKNCRLINKKLSSKPFTFKTVEILTSQGHHMNQNESEFHLLFIALQGIIKLLICVHFCTSCAVIID